jgi:hypothetical protein
MRKLHKKLVTAVAIAMLATLGLAGSAGAVTTDPTTAKVPTLNLSAAQRQELQARVDEALTDLGGGKQIGINQIAYKDGSVLTLVLPGEVRARTVDRPIPSVLAPDCPFRWACIWPDTNFRGDRWERTNCELLLNLPARFLTSLASIQNNQTPGTQTVIYNGRGEILNASLAPSRINDTGVLNRSQARRWRVC